MSERRQKIVLGLRWLFGAVMIVAGVFHFVTPEVYLQIMPDYLPWHLELVYVSGVFEVLGGIGLFVPKLRSLAGWGIIALLLAVWPANIWQATQGGLGIPPEVAWVRVALQPALIWLAYVVSRD
jgi:uncharacterized membrane protein